jgi:isopentenyl-diphosphate delta-isomerase
MQELVVLVDESDRMLGTMPKSEVHGSQTPLHRAFSCFIFRAGDQQLLLQQRSREKRTWPLVWSNSCCGHPSPGEPTLQAARRRLRHELGIEATPLEVVAPYRYCFTRDGMMENEICPLLVGIVDSEPVANPREVEAVRWIEWEAFLGEIEHEPLRYSEWCVEEARILDRTPRVRQILNRR